MFCATDYMVVGFTINALKFLSATDGIFPVYLRMKTTGIKVGEGTTDGAASHFSKKQRIPPVFPAVFIWTRVRRVMAGTAPGAWSVSHLP